MAENPTPQKRSAPPLMMHEIALGLVIVIVLGAISMRYSDFIAPRSLAGIADDTALLLILAIGQAIVLIARAVDLSVAANVALSGMVAALFNVSFPQLGVGGALLASTACGALLGAVNGVLVWRFAAPPIVVTLATMSVFRGAAYFSNGGAWVNSGEMSPEFLNLPRLTVLGLGIVTWLSMIALVGIGLALRYTRFGRTIFLAGDNPVAAPFVGVQPAKAQFWAFVVSGTLAGIVGYFWVSRFGVAYSDTAVGFELQVIAACVIGGVAINGGSGSLLGVALGCAFLGIIKNALPLIGVSPFWQMAVSGAVILIAVLANVITSRPPRRQILEVRRL